MAFDSREYGWSDLTAVFGGRDLTGIRGVKYTEKIEREPLFAKGRYPHSIQSGNVSVEGEITMLQSEHEALIKAGNGSILNLKGLDLIVSYGDATAGDAVITNRIENLYVTESGDELKQGDKNMEITLPFLATRIRRQV